MAGDPKPPDPPDVIAARYAEAAKKAVTATAQVAIDAFDKVNGPTGTQPGTLEPKDAIASLAQLAGAALTGGMSLARVALQVQWDRRVLLVADNVASIVGNGLDDVIDVVEDAAKKAGPKPFKEQQQEWVDAAIRLTSVGAIRGAEIPRPSSPDRAPTPIRSSSDLSPSRTTPRRPRTPRSRWRRSASPAADRISKRW